MSDINPGQEFNYVKLFAKPLFYAAVLIISSGTFNFPIGWVFIACLLLSHVVLLFMSTVRQHVHDNLFSEHVPIYQLKHLDAVFRIVYPIMFLMMLILAGLEVRLADSDIFPEYVRLFAGVLLVLSQGLILWAIWTNPFFRVETAIFENHEFIGHGPYRLVRHPGYIGGMLMTISIPFLFGAFLSLIPAVVNVTLLAFRASSESKLLEERLPNY